MEAVNAAAPPKLDVVRVLLAAFVAPFFHKRALLPFALAVFAAEVANSLDESTLGLLRVPATLAALVLTVASHRVFVLGPREAAGHSVQWWVGRIARLGGWMLVIGFITFVAALPTMLVVLLMLDPDMARAAAGAIEGNVTGLSTRELLIYVVMLPALYVASRLSLVLPAVATRDEAGDPGKAWSLGAGNGLRLLLVMNLLPGAVGVLLQVVLTGESLPIEIIRTAILVYAVLVQTAALSMAYRELTQLSPPR